MNVSEVSEYKVKVFHYTEEAEEKWSGFVLAFPFVSAEGDSREEVLEEIQDKLSKITASSEIVTVSVAARPESSQEENNGETQSALAAKLHEQGYRHFGIFAKDPDALNVFDEIEDERDQITVGDE